MLSGNKIVVSLILIKLDHQCLAYWDSDTSICYVLSLPDKK